MLVGRRKRRKSFDRERRKPFDRERRKPFDEERRRKDGEGGRERNTLFRKVNIGKSSECGNA